MKPPYFNSTVSSQILRRPIAVSMCLIALTVMGIPALRHIPVSVMPDIDVQQISVQVSMFGYSAQEVEQNIVSPLRGRWMQVAGVTDIRSESHMGAGSVHISFEPDNNSGDRAMWTYVDIVHSNISSFRQRRSVCDVAGKYRDSKFRRIFINRRWVRCINRV